MLLVLVANGDGTSTRLDDGGDDVSADVIQVSVQLGCWLAASPAVASASSHLLKIVWMLVNSEYEYARYWTSKKVPNFVATHAIRFFSTQDVKSFKKMTYQEG